ncbi:hypothetical protein [Helicobacter rodentium]|nr:hypothetical protein [Helicobacter rodentium]
MGYFNFYLRGCAFRFLVESRLYDSIVKIILFCEIMALQFALLISRND